MTLLIIDSALPLLNGTPRQRSSAARREAIAGDAAAVHLTIDILGTEHRARFQRARGDRFIGQLPRTDRDASKPGFSPSEPAGARWLSPRRTARLEAVLARHKPSAVVIGDPLLFPLVPLLADLDGGFHLFDDDAAGWHDRAARRQGNHQDSDYHRRFAALLRQGDKELKLLKPASRASTPARHPGSDAARLAKVPTVLALASGHQAADLQSLALLDKAAATLAESRPGSEPPDVVAIGFERAQSAPFRRINAIESFTHLDGMAATARCVVLPWLCPELACLAQGALLAGTPVITFATERVPPQLAGSDGLIVTAPERLADVLDLLLDEELVGEADWHALSQAEEQRVAALGGGVLPPIGLQEPRPLRIRPLIRRPEVVYNPLSNMLLVRLAWRSGAPVEEVRLLNDSGVELNRLMPTDQESLGDPVTIEGGAVVNLGELGEAVVIELHDSGSVIERHRIPVEQFVMLQAELAWLKRERGRISGAFWLSNKATAPGWSIASGEVDLPIKPEREIPMPEIAGRILCFSAPLDIAPRTPVILSRLVAGSVARLETADQRPLLPPPELVNPQLDDDPLLESLRGIHAGKRAWVIGNGPSVRTEDLSRIPPDDVKFCFNRFYLSYPRHSLREDYVVSADTLMIRDFGQEMIERSTGLPLFCLKPSNTPVMSGPHVVLRPYSGYLPLFSTVPAAWVAVGGSSVYVALQMAFFMGVREVVLYGMDYSFSMTLRRDPRFPFPISSDDGNHFIESYRSAKPWCPPTWRDISASFLNARVAFEAQGASIVNATRGGKLTTFPRVAFDDLVP